MTTVRLIEYRDASDDVRAVFDDIKRTRKIDDVNNFWKALANHPSTLERTWNSLKSVMQPGALDPLIKELIYIAVSVTNGCDYCTHSHTANAVAKGMTPDQYAELIAVIAMANETNTLADSFRVPVDPAYLK